MSVFTTYNGPQQFGPSMQNVTQLIDAYTNVYGAYQNVEGRVAIIEGNYVNNMQLNNTNSNINNIAVAYATNNQLATVNAKIDSKAYTADIDNNYYNKTDINSIINGINSNINNINASIANFTTEEQLSSNINIVTGITSSISNEVAIMNNQFIYNNNDIVGINKPLQVKKDIEYIEYAVMNTGVWASAESNNTFSGAYILGEVSELVFGEDNEPKHSKVYIKYLNSKPFDATIDIVVTRKDTVITGILKAFVSKSIASDWHNLKFFLVRGTNANDDTPRVWLAMSSSDIGATDRSNLYCNIAGINFTTVADLTSIPNGSVEIFSEVIVPDNMISGTVLSTVVADTTYVNSIIVNNTNKILGIDGSINLTNSIISNSANINNLAAFSINSNSINSDNINANNVTISNLQVNNLTTRPVLANSVVSTIADITGIIPIGAGIRWGSSNIPACYLAAGTEFNITDYPDLALIYPDGILPIEDNTIFLAKYIINNAQ